MTSIGQSVIKGQKHSIRLSKHLKQRMNERGILVKDIIETINSLNFLQLGELKDLEKEIAIVDYNKNHTLIIAFKDNTLYAITILRGTNNVIKDKTEIVEVGDKNE